jgi:integral membrane protein
VVSVDLAIKARWSIKGTVLVLLAGTIPFLSFVAERRVTHRVGAGQPV